MALNMAAYEPPDFYEFEVSPDLAGPTTAPASTSFVNVSLGAVPPPHVDTPVEHLKTVLVAGAVVSLIFLIAKDAHRAFTRRAHWIPCDFLVLSAFSIQMLNMLNIQNEALAANSPQGNNTTMSTFSETARWALGMKVGTTGQNVQGGGQSARWKDFLMIHNSRTILCVFTAYVMPSMADPGLEYAWVRWTALVITVFHHVTSQFYSVKRNSDDGGETLNLLRIWPEPHDERTPPYYVYATIISLCFILLLLLLGCATIAGKSIERIVAQQIPLVLRGEGELISHPAAKTKDVHRSADKKEGGDQAEKTEDVPQPEKTQAVHRHHFPLLRNVKFDGYRADQHYHLHHLRNDSEEETHNHSCEEITEEGAERVEEERYRRHCHYCWRRVEDAVLKAWIIVRAYSVQPVLARSALSASAAVIVTIQIAITIAGGLSKVLEKENGGQSNTFQLVALAVQSIFILMAWAIINIRWGIAVAYHQRRDSDTWYSGLKVEDFWTRHLEELMKQGKESKPKEARALDKEIDQLVSTKKTTLPSFLLDSAMRVQWLLVKFSKVCWFVSLRILHNELMVYLFKCMFERYILCVYEDFPKYSKLLEEVQMLGESPESLWVSNRNSIKEARRITIEGNQDAEINCEDLVEFLMTNRTAQPHTDLSFIIGRKKSIQRTPQPEETTPAESRGGAKDPLSVERPFSEDTGKSWKLKAVSILGIIVQLSPFHSIVDKGKSSTSNEADKNQSPISTSNEADKNQSPISTSSAFPPEDVKKCMKLYSQAWEIIDFVDEAEAETEADRISTQAADKYFQALHEWVTKEDIPRENWRPETEDSVRDALAKLKKETLELRHLDTPKGWVGETWEKITSKLKRKRVTKTRCEGNDSINWTAVASGRAVYNLCESIECSYRGDVTGLQKELESSLAYIIRECLEKSQNLLLLKSRKWALHRDEKRLGKALYAAGKAKVLMQNLASNKLAIVYYD